MLDRTLLSIHEYKSARYHRPISKTLWNAQEVLGSLWWTSIHYGKRCHVPYYLLGNCNEISKTCGAVFFSIQHFHLFATRHYLLYNVLSGLWIMAAKWEFEENKNIPNSRSLLQRGLRVNSSSQQLWLEVR